MRMAESSSKRHEAEENDGRGTDRLSNLPESVQLHILSFLPTRTSVATMSLVSRTWRHLWQHLQVFDFDYYHDEDPVDLNMFINFAFFVNAVLALRRSRDIQKMHLDCSISDEDKFTADSIQLWVRTAIGPRLEEFNLCICFKDGSRFVVLPPSLFNCCTNLVSLSLCGAIRVMVNVQHSSPVHFPSLKMLQLDIQYVDSLNALLSGCPVLESLDITHDAKSFTVPPSLKRLKFTGEDYFSEMYLEIDAPGLQYLSITTTSGTFDAAVGNLQNVVEAFIDVFYVNESVFVNPVLNLLRALSGIKRLVFYLSTTERLPLLYFPEFHCLLNLELLLPNFNLSYLLNVLQKCHVLQVLTIANNRASSPLQTWEPQSTKVPNCLVSHLTYIRIEGYQGSDDELEFAEYILRNGLVLKTMIIVADNSLDVAKKCCIVKRLSDIPWGSVTCQLKFDVYP